MVAAIILLPAVFLINWNLQDVDTQKGHLLGVYFCNIFNCDLNFDFATVTLAFGIIFWQYLGNYDILNWIQIKFTLKLYH